MKDTYNVGYKTEDIKCIIVDFIAEDGKGGFPIMRQGTYVLCKDCKYWEKEYDEYDGEEWWTCGKYEPYNSNDVMHADDFCSRGVKR